MRRRAWDLRRRRFGKKALRIAVVGRDRRKKNPEAKIVLVNPEIIHAEGEKREGKKDAFRFRDSAVYVVRPQFCDGVEKRRTRKGETFENSPEKEFTGAGAFCHEIDHLNGILFLGALEHAENAIYNQAGKIKKLRKQGGVVTPEKVFPLAGDAGWSFCGDARICSSLP